MNLFPQSGAILSDCERYRYRLWRRWAPGPRVIWIMLNPSTADASEDDPTVRRCIGFARSWGFGGIEVLNLFPWRATSPDDLVKAAESYDVVCRRERDRHIAAVLDVSGSAPVAAWGAHRLAVDESARLVPLVSAMGSRLLCLGTTKAGAPRHPLYVRGDTRPIEWEQDDD